MPPDIEVLLLRLIGGDATAPGEILDCASTNDSPSLLVAAALVSGQPGEPAAGFLARAAQNAATTRDRQLVALATAHFEHNADLLDALVRDHLSDHPDNILAAWIASLSTHTDRPDRREEQRDVHDTPERP